MNQTVDPEALPYVTAVRARLRGMPAEDLDEIVSDLEQHLAELLSESGEPLQNRLGAPDDYAEELAQTAEWAVRETPGLLERANSWWNSAQMTAAGRWWARSWEEFRPGWWVARGLIVPLVLFALYVGDAFDAWPWLWVLVAVAVSVGIGRRRNEGVTWRLANTFASLVTVWVVLAGALNGIGIYDRDIRNTYLNENPTGIVGPNGPITDFYAYEADGTPVTVFLYDQYGVPIATPASESATRFLSNGVAVVNIFPVDPSGPQTLVRTPTDVLACESIEEPVPTTTCRTFKSPPSD